MLTMLFAHERDALAWYEQQERVLTPQRIAAIPWHDIRTTPLRQECIPILRYMRDVETFTVMYYDELLRTPTGHDPVIRQFMDRWSTEEPVHGELLERFLGEAGVPANPGWKERAFAAIPKSYHRTTRLTTAVTNAVGRHFSAVHMTWGTINELSTLNGYLRLWQLARHPVLEQLLRLIAREEARHAFFYWSVARIRLLRSRFRQCLTRCIVRTFWAPVGSGAKPEREASAVIGALFRGLDGVAFFDRNVNRRIEDLPGLAGLKTMTARITAAAEAA